mmetsp:Transcript_52576/g.122979  ORF Transcript_52576/g.122979 Transcript_52576/m.122979 type:complete len:231 (+) Transcript_52576:3-695(+)
MTSHLYGAPTPNPWKVSIFLEEAGLSYTHSRVNLLQGEQNEGTFVAKSPNGKVPALEDKSVEPPICLMESGAILFYLSEKHGCFLPTEPRARADVVQWVFWQMAGLGPMQGQCNVWNRYAKEDVPPAQERYVRETTRLYKVLDTQLEGKEYICGEVSIADFSAYPWAIATEWAKVDISGFPNVLRWMETMAARPGVQRGLATFPKLDPSQYAAAGAQLTGNKPAEDQPKQ